MKAIVLVSLLFANSAAAAQTTPTPAAVTTATTAPTDPAQAKMICRTEEVLGSRIGGHKICHTKAQWNEIAADSRQQFEQNTREFGGGKPMTGIGGH